jgi:hypothetical protein
LQLHTNCGVGEVTYSTPYELLALQVGGVGSAGVGEEHTQGLKPGSEKLMYCGSYCSTFAVLPWLVHCKPLPLPPSKKPKLVLPCMTATQLQNVALEALYCSMVPSPQLGGAGTALQVLAAHGAPVNTHTQLQLLPLYCSAAPMPVHVGGAMTRAPPTVKAPLLTLTLPDSVVAPATDNVLPSCTPCAQQGASALRLEKKACGTRLRRNQHAIGHHAPGEGVGCAGA